MAEYRLCALDELDSGEARRLNVAGQRLAVVRIDDAVYVVGDRCSHAEASLAEGDVDVASCRIECPKHGAEFSLVTGAAETLPATKPVPTYATRIENGEVFVEVA